VSYSRGALVTLVPLAILAAYLRWVRPAYLAAAAVAATLVLPIVASEYLIQRLSSLTTVADLSGERSAGDPAVQGRATEMLAGVQAWSDHPVLGVGPGQYMAIHSVAYQQRNPELIFKEIATPRRAHSLYVEMAAEIGAAGLAVFLSIVLLLMRDLWRARRRLAIAQPEHADLAAGFFLTLVAYLGTGMFLSFSYERYFWLLLALASAALYVTQQITHGGEQTHMRRGSWPPSPRC
jgi:O-antigen ligase